MISIETKNGKFYINGKEVFDPLEFTREEQKVLKQFKKSLKRGIRIKSTSN